MKSSIPSIVDLAQSGFIPRKQLLDNVLLATELIKGYCISLSSRCMINIDITKAYDSVE